MRFERFYWPVVGLLCGLALTPSCGGDRFSPFAPGSAGGQGGSAGAAACGSGQTDCDGGCVSLARDNLNCGSCGHTCQTGETCSGGECMCAAGRELCGDTCVEFASDPDNCGQCNTTCGPDQVCSESSCASDCTGELTRCGRMCVDVQSSIEHCGGCDSACGPGEICQAGSCACAGGQERCGSICVPSGTCGSAGGSGPGGSGNAGGSGGDTNGGGMNGGSANGGSGGSGTVTPGQLIVEYQNPSPMVPVGTITDQMRANLRISNRSDSEAPLNGLRLRYYFSNEAVGAANPLMVSVDFAEVQPSSALHFDSSCTTYGPAPGADAYCELVFTDSLAVLAGSYALINFRMHDADYASMFDITNDYSWDATKPEFAEWDHITLESGDGTLIWGAEP